MNYLKVCALHGGAADFNFSSYYAADADMSSVRDEVETLPMMAPRRVILLKEVQDLTDREWTTLEPLFQEPVQSSVFILIGSKIDKRKNSSNIFMSKRKWSNSKNLLKIRFLVGFAISAKAMISPSRMMRFN